jgi:hypothetical protein
LPAPICFRCEEAPHARTIVVFAECTVSTPQDREHFPPSEWSGFLQRLLGRCVHSTSRAPWKDPQAVRCLLRDHREMTERFRTFQGVSRFREIPLHVPVLRRTHRLQISSASLRKRSPAISRSHRFYPTFTSSLYIVPEVHFACSHTSAYAVSSCESPAVQIVGCRNNPLCLLQSTQASRNFAFSTHGPHSSPRTNFFVLKVLHKSICNKIMVKRKIAKKSPLK